MTKRDIISAMSERTQIHIRVGEPLRSHLQDVAAKRGITVTDLILAALAADPEIVDAIIFDKLGYVPGTKQARVIGKAVGQSTRSD